MTGVRETGVIDAGSATRWLRSRGLLTGESTPLVRPLAGGVSNVVLAVDADGRRLVIKQALGRLRVEAEWLAMRERALIEARALTHARAIVGDAVPRVIDVDEDSCAIVLERAPDGWADWKPALLRGEADPAVAAAAGRVIGAVHAATRGDAVTEAAFGDWRPFRELRLDPFHRHVAAVHPELAPVLEGLIERMSGRRIALVHGDCSPKNLLVGPGPVWLIDWEVAHYGDPTFDVAFMVCHLVLKTVHRPGCREPLGRCIRAFLTAHGDVAGTDILDADEWLMRQVAGLLLARVDGKSPAGYLSSTEADEVRRLALAWLREPPPSAQAWPLP
jgi:aminoglycoside phosphotransferase (APT) family kinase protein